MSAQLMVEPLGRLGRLADVMAMPLMYLLSGTFSERPQHTHFWNNQKLKREDVECLDEAQMIYCEGIRGTKKRRFLGFPLFHVPILGGWRDYIVAVPAGISNEAWHVGWITSDAIGVSRILLRGPVRLLLGPDPVSFFGVSTKKNGGAQKKISWVGVGRIGNGGLFTDIPLS